MNTSSQQPAVTLQDLEAFLEETLTDSEMARIESALRADPELRRQLAELVARRDQGEHSVGGDLAAVSDQLPQPRRVGFVSGQRTPQSCRRLLPVSPGGDRLSGVSGQPGRLARTQRRVIASDPTLTPHERCRKGVNFFQPGLMLTRQSDPDR
jgi:anti-sigma factor RsiW